MLTQEKYNSNHLICPSRELSFLEQIASLLFEASLSLNDNRRRSLGQFFTPLPIARMMSSMVSLNRDTIRLLDAGAGCGILAAAFVAAAIESNQMPKEIILTAFELDESLIPYLEQALNLCQKECHKNGIKFIFEIKNEDFIASASKSLSNDLFSPFETQLQFDLAILNPPYGKINTNSEANQLLRRGGIAAPNLYAAFLALSAELLSPGGELVAITPRSFCNGTYFKSFRQYFLERMSFRRFHVFDSRKENFDDILQENIIFHAVKDKSRHSGETDVLISTSHNGNEAIKEFIRLKPEELILPDDKDMFIHLGADELDSSIVERINCFQNSLKDLELSVSTGKVVDFRAKEYLQNGIGDQAAPLIYPHNLQNGVVNYPVNHTKKYNALQITPETESALINTGTYVLVKRFSAKEEKKRITAVMFSPEDVGAQKIGFENHLNYFHAKGQGIDSDLAKGLTLYLNSSLLDAYFRQFSGHTQVNASDLRYLKYPIREELENLGKHYNGHLPSQDEIDQLINRILLKMSDTNFDTEHTKKRIEEALSVLREMGFPLAQQNERSALALLALLDLKPDAKWSDASDPLIGVTQMMKYFADVYGKQYMPNTRESVRKLTVHQFLNAGLIVMNPDQPDRPINSGKTVYQITPAALKLLQKYGAKEWIVELKNYLSEVGTLQEKYAQSRQMKRLPVTLPSGQTITLSPGGQNVLITEIIENFCSYFTPGGQVLYVGDADEKWAVFDEAKLSNLGITFDSHGKMPDVVVFFEEKNWLVLIEAVTSHGPVNPKRREELKKLFAHSTVGLVFVTAFPNRKIMMRYLSEIAWETEVWVADAPTHLIHFNGERFLGPYE